MDTSLPLRPYQQAALDALVAAWAGDERPTGEGVVNRAAVVLATGLGKTVIFAHLILWFLQPHPGRRVVVMVHRDELAQQAKAKIHSVAPHLRVGVVMAGRNEVNADVVIVSVQTVGPGLVRRAKGTLSVREEMRGVRADDIRGVGLVIVDECHHAAAPTWRASLEHFGSYAGVPTAGFTATMARQDKLGLGEIWDEIVFQRDTLWGIENRFLCDVRGKRIQVPALDLSGVHVRAGDLQQEEVGARMMDANTGEAIAKAIVQEAPERRGAIFAPNVATCHSFAEALNDHDQKAEVVIGTTSPGARREIFHRFAEGITRHLVSGMVLTEGWDAPHCDLVVPSRLTQSEALYQQMVGRGLRLYPGKTDCLVMDPVGLSSRHTLVGLAQLFKDRPMSQGRSVLGAWDDEPTEAGAEFLDEPEAPPPVHKIRATDVDLLAARDTVWLRTRGRGTWFIPAGENTYYLWPEFEPDGTHSGLVTVAQYGPGGSFPLKQGITFDMAMTWAEKYAAQDSKSWSKRTASWRKKPAAPEEIRLAADRNLPPIIGEVSRGEVWDQIHITDASRVLDW